MGPVRYTSGIGDWEVQSASREDFLQTQLTNWGRSDFNACEYLEPDDLIQPVLDYDEWVEQEPTSDAVHGALMKCRAAIEHLCSSEDRFEYDQHVFEASRHGYSAPTQKWKISWRFAIHGLYAIKLKDMATLLREVQREEDVGLWDMSLYKGRRLLAVPGGCKGKGDDRVLDMPDRRDAYRFLAQALNGDEIFLEFPDQPQFRQGKTIDPGDAAEMWERGLPFLHSSGFIFPRVVGRREKSITFSTDNRSEENPCPCCTRVHDRQNWWMIQKSDGSFLVKNYSEHCVQQCLGTPSCMIKPEDDTVPLLQLAETGRQIVEAGKHITEVAERQAYRKMVQSLTPEVERVMGGSIEIFEAPCSREQTTNSFRFQVQNSTPCALCNGHHGTSLYDCSCVLTPCFAVRNVQPQCKERLVGWKAVKAFTDVMDNPRGDAPYAQLFKLQQQSLGLVWKHDGDSFYRHDGVLWRSQTDTSFRQALQDNVRPMLSNLSKLINNEAVDNGKKGKETDSQSSSMYRASQLLEQNHKVDMITKECKNAYYDSQFQTTMDQEPYVCGMNNGIVDLQSCTFRLSKPDDMVSMTVGYDWPAQWDPQIEAELMEFMSKVYPLDDERKLLQKFAGYCLLGRHPSKYFALLMDVRGGYNAKSTILSLLKAAMGEYATKAEASFLYKTDHVRNINDHNAGLLGFQHTRLVEIEETDGSKVLNAELMKDLNGGETPQVGRQMYSSVTKEFVWKAKIIMAFNEGKFPQFDVDDRALVERMLTIPHRSRFQNEVTSEPYTFPVDPDLKQKFAVWRPYMLKFMLNGLRMYHEEGFRQIPDTCQTFKQKLVSDKDTIHEFLHSTVEFTGAKSDFLSVKMLFNEYDESYKALQRDRKTKKDSKAFQAGVKRCLPDSWREKLPYSKEGKKTMTSNVIVGFKRKPVE